MSDRDHVTSVQNLGWIVQDQFHVNVVGSVEFVIVQSFMKNKSL
jgi:hypothetical protein